MNVKRMAFAAESGRLLEIWAQSFEEDPAYAAQFVRVFPPARHCLVCEMDGGPVSMVWMLDAQLRRGEQTLPAQYIYAAATLPPYRGRGIFGELLQEAQRRAREDGCAASFLRPASDGLFPFYRRFGYVPYFYATQEIYTRAQLREDADCLPVTLVSPDTYARVRSGFGAALPLWVEWGTDVLAYARDLAGDAGGLAVTPRGCAVCETEEDVLQVRELWCAPEDRRAVLASLARRFPCQTICARYPATEGRARPFGVLCPLHEDVWRAEGQETKPYMGLALE